MNQTSLTNTLQDILRDAEQAHHELVEEMAREGKDTSRENKNWHRFYAEYVSRRLAPYLCGLQCSPRSWVDPRAMRPAAGKWDKDSTGRLENCHDTGDC